MTTAFERLLADPKMQWKDFPLEDIPPVHDYEHALRMFAPSTSPRYQPRDGLTFCNIFISDVTRALAKHWLAEELPHRVDGAEQTMNMMIDRLRDGVPGWSKVPSVRGEPAMVFSGADMHTTLVTWHSGYKGPGHGAFVVPQAMPESVGDIILAQAGQKCGTALPLRECFGRKKWPELEWWVAS